MKKYFAGIDVQIKTGCCIINENTKYVTSGCVIDILDASAYPFTVYEFFNGRDCEVGGMDL